MKYLWNLGNCIFILNDYNKKYIGHFDLNIFSFKFSSIIKSNYDNYASSLNESPDMYFSNIKNFAISYLELFIIWHDVFLLLSTKQEKKYSIFQRLCLFFPLLFYSLYGELSLMLHRRVISHSSSVHADSSLLSMLLVARQQCEID